MVRTKDNNAGVKVGAKAPRKGLAGPSTSAPTSSTAKKPRDDSGGNPVCPRETPAWQKPITDFFRQQPNSDADGRSKENVNPEEAHSKPSPEEKKGDESTEGDKPEQTSESDQGNPDSSGTSKD